jgi:transcriptional regulator with XRE-family HTH domain
MNLGITISELRKARKIKQHVFAERCNITQAYLSLIENNKKEPTLSILKEIASKLKVPLPIIFFLSIERTDVPEGKGQVYDAITPTVKNLIENLFSFEDLANKK